MRKIKRKIAEIKNENKMRLNNNFKIQPTDVEKREPGAGAMEGLDRSVEISISIVSWF